MRIGFLGPVTLGLLGDLLPYNTKLPIGFQFAPAAQWIRALVRRGHHVAVYTTARDVSTPVDIQGERLRIMVAPERASGAARDFFAFERAGLQRHLDGGNCEVLHAHWTYEFALAAISSGKPTLITVHDLPWNVLRYFRDPHRVGRLMMAYAVALRGRHFTAVSEDAALHFRRYMRPGAEIDVIPNGLPDAMFDLPEPQVKELGEACTFATILQGWSRRKNPVAALKAFAIARSSLPGARLMAFGVDYEEGGPAHQWAQEHHHDEGVHFLGPLPHPELLSRLQAEVDIIVHPSLDEAFSMTALEALAIRKPFIAGKSTPGMRDLLGGGEAGILVDVRNPQAIADQMIRLAIDPKLRALIAQAGYDRASRLYRLDGVMEQYEALYTSIQVR